MGEIVDISGKTRDPGVYLDNEEAYRQEIERDVRGGSRVYLEGMVLKDLLSMMAKNPELSSSLDIRAFGATSDVDIKTALQAAVDGAKGRAVIIPSGTWILATPVVLPSDTTLMLQPGAVLRCTVATGNAISAEGTEGSVIPVSVDVPRNTRTITAPGHGLAAGDLFKLGSLQVYDSFSTGSTIGELLYVDSVLGDVITTVSPVVGGPYTVAGTAGVSKINPVKNISILGSGTIQGNKVAASNQMCVYLRYAVNTKIDGIKLKNFDQRHLAFRDCSIGRITNCDFDWAIHTSQAYGVSVIDATQDFVIAFNTFTNVRHSTSTNNSSPALGRGIPRRVLIAYNTASWTSTALGGSMLGGDAFDTHTAAEEIWFESNTVNGGAGSGINFECRSGRVSNNYISNVAGAGISIHNESDLNGSIIAENNTVVNPGLNGYNLYPATRGASSYYTDILLAGNKVSGVTGTSTAYKIGATITPATLDRNVRIVNNVVVDSVCSYLYYLRNVQAVHWVGNQSINSTGAISVIDTPDVTADDPGFTSKNIASESITIDTAARLISLGPGSGNTTANLSSILGGRRGQMLLIRLSAISNTITFVTTGNIRLTTGSSYALTGSATLQFYHDGTNWREFNRNPVT